MFVIREKKRMACAWALTGLSFGENAFHCDPATNQPVWAPDLQGFQESSWVVVTFNGGKRSPDSPCDIGDVYMASLHFAVMSITSEKE